MFKGWLVGASLFFSGAAFAGEVGPLHCWDNSDNDRQVSIAMAMPKDNSEWQVWMYTQVIDDLLEYEVYKTLLVGKLKCEQTGSAFEIQCTQIGGNEVEFRSSFYQGDSKYLLLEWRDGTSFRNIMFKLDAFESGCGIAKSKYLTN